MHWIMGKYLFNPFCMMRELNMFHILLVIATWQTWQPSVLMLVKVQSCTGWTTGKPSWNHLPKLPDLPASSCKPRVLVILDLKKSKKHPVPLPLPASLAPELSCCSVDSWRLVVGDLKSRDWEVGTRWRTSGLTYVPCFPLNQSSSDL